MRAKAFRVKWANRPSTMGRSDLGQTDQSFVFFCSHILLQAHISSSSSSATWSGFLSERIFDQQRGKETANSFQG
ncbi:MAG: hypothetical protein JAZ03_22915 [Candidatus Thiodiazotropha taylori]|nr:hypothetical protein [Candidatus Thiodiazotropha taylori]